MKKTEKPQFEFHKINSGFVPAAGRRGSGWWLDVKSDRFHLDAILKGVSLPPFGPDLFAIAKDPARREDFPDVSSPVFLIVSERARVVMEEEAPGNCQYLPIDVKHEGRVIDSSYSIVNCLHLLECIDEVRSVQWQFEKDWLPTRDFMRVEVDASRVPQDVAIFRVVDHYVSIFIRERVRLALKKAKLTGWTAWQG